MFLYRKTSSIGPPSSSSGAGVAQVDPVFQSLPNPSNQPVVQTLQKLSSRADATVLTGGKIAVSQSETQMRRPWWQRRLSL